MTPLIPARAPPEADRRSVARWPAGARLLLLAAGSAALWGLAIVAGMSLLNH